MRSCIAEARLVPHHYSGTWLDGGCVSIPDRHRGVPATKLVQTGDDRDPLPDLAANALCVF